MKRLLDGRSRSRTNNHNISQSSVVVFAQIIGHVFFGMYRKICPRLPCYLHAVFTDINCKYASCAQCTGKLDMEQSGNAASNDKNAMPRLQTRLPLSKQGTSQWF